MHRLEENEMNAKNLKTDDKIFFRGIYQIKQPRLHCKTVFDICNRAWYNCTNEVLPSKDLQRTE